MLPLPAGGDGSRRGVRAEVGGRYLVMFAASEAANTREGHNRGPLWTPAQWAPLCALFLADGAQPVFVGAECDLVGKHGIQHPRHVRRRSARPRCVSRADVAGGQPSRGCRRCTRRTGSWLRPGADGQAPWPSSFRSVARQGQRARRQPRVAAMVPACDVRRPGFAASRLPARRPWHSASVGQVPGNAPTALQATMVSPAADAWLAMARTPPCQPASRACRRSEAARAPAVMRTKSLLMNRHRTRDRPDPCGRRPAPEPHNRALRWSGRWAAGSTACSPTACTSTTFGCWTDARIRASWIRRCCTLISDGAFGRCVFNVTRRVSATWRALKETVQRSDRTSLKSSS